MWCAFDVYLAYKAQRTAKQVKWQSEISVCPCDRLYWSVVWNSPVKMEGADFDIEREIGGDQSFLSAC